VLECELFITGIFIVIGFLRSYLSFILQILEMTALLEWSFIIKTCRNIPQIFIGSLSQKITGYIDTMCANDP
jgi:hypothetical protein